MQTSLPPQKSDPTSTQSDDIPLHKSYWPFGVGFVMGMIFMISSLVYTWKDPWFDTQSAKRKLATHKKTIPHRDPSHEK